MRRALGVAVALVVGLAGTVLAGAMYRNDSGTVARAVRIEFSEPAEVTSMWPSFPQRDPQGPATVIVLSGGEVPAGGWFSFTWRPDTARVVKIEWLTQTATTLSLIHERTWQPHFSLPPASETLFRSPEPQSTWELSYTEVYFEDFEEPVVRTPGPKDRVSYGRFFLSSWGATFVGNPQKVVGGQTALSLSHYGVFEINPGAFILEPWTSYIVEFDYLDRVGDDGQNSVLVFLIPVGASDLTDAICLRGLLKSSPEKGVYSAGAQTGEAAGYYLRIMAMGGVSISIDNVRIFRQDRFVTDSGRNLVESVAQLPFPRLGNYLMGTTTDMSGRHSQVISVDDIERRAAMFDVLVGVDLSEQTMDPDYPRRLRELNPGVVILPYKIAQEYGPWERGLACGCAGGNIALQKEYGSGIAHEWVVRTVSGRFVEDPVWKNTFKMNISPDCPIIDGRTFNDHLARFTVDSVFASGLWDGVYFDNLFDRINPHIPDWSDPSRLDFDINVNKKRDETPALISEITRAAALGVLQRIRLEIGLSQLIIGNTGPLPALSLTPLVNGYLFEGWNYAWCYRCGGYPSEAGWKRALDDYLYMTRYALRPAISVIEGMGWDTSSSLVSPDRFPVEPKREDIRNHRFTMCSALLGDGFYEYDLFDGRSMPYWFDEFAVNGQGIAVEDVRFKGYLGHPLGEAVELALPGKAIWKQDFEGSGLPSDMWATHGVRASRSGNEAIAGSGSLVIESADHTKADYRAAGTAHTSVLLQSGVTYVVEFDWRILETLSGWVAVGFRGASARTPGDYPLPGVVRGDTGRARFPVTIPSGSDFSLSFMLFNGGKVAIDNVSITEGGAGPWRRDFENGFVLVNPLHQTFTLDQEALGGPLGRTGIRRILGTQAPDVNTGEPVTGPLVLAPFDAIILLADPLPRK